MRLLTDLVGESLWRGDIIRLVDNYDLGPGSGPVDLMIYDPNQDDTGLGLIVVSGEKAGLTLSVFPLASKGEGKRNLETTWLLRNWNDWFCYSYVTDQNGNLLPIPVEGTLVIAPHERKIVIRDDAHSRPA